MGGIDLFLDYIRVPWSMIPVTSGLIKNYFIGNGNDSMVSLKIITSCLNCTMLLLVCVLYRSYESLNAVVGRIYINTK